MTIILYPDARLNRSAEPRVVDDALRATGERLLTAAQNQNAYGLAAAHLGEVEPVVTISADGKNHRLMFNARIVAAAPDVVAGDEGSVSLPGLQIEIKRSIWVDVAYDDAAGRAHSERLDGFLGRVAQHEIDQMNGMFFLDRLSRLKRDMILKKLRKLAG